MTEQEWVDPDDLDEQWGPDPRNEDDWFRCVRCRRRHARPPIVVFAVEDDTDEATAAYEFCPPCGGERLGLGAPTYPPPRYHPDDPEAGEAGEAGGSTREPTSAAEAAAPAWARDPLLVNAVARDLRDVLAPAPPVPGLIRPLNAFLILGALQLALRHPELPDTTRKATEDFTRQLVEIVALTPALRRIAELGFDPAADVPRDAAYEPPEEPDVRGAPF